ncbi:MAG: ribonuclease III [Paludibacter sp.]|nr:ribonuclease III [Bacteroidales bacterium]MCM1069383.1 ribonuclease III [Prevotella sp.]MCM1353903.1 ribonuclease III [Bacteroides sp.]MCM1442847.1 ribonuclease III [Muribaculum sp.]MCM1481892.1 ribonuclease III [Paludibacter sp.]
MTLRNWINRCRLSSVERREPCLFLSSLLGYSPSNWTLYEQALTHRSLSQDSNERLEFLGDAVIGVVVADVLYRLYPDAQEGLLSRYRSKVVCRDRLNRIARNMGLPQHLKIGGQLKKNAEDVYGNALEALVGAVYEEAGYARAQAFVCKYIVGRESALQHELEEKGLDYKSMLLEWGQRYKKEVSFTLLKDAYEAATDTHLFVYQAKAIEYTVQGGGHTKREAQQNAARKMLTLLQRYQQ